MSNEVRAYNRAWYHSQSPEWKARKQERTKQRRDRLYQMVADYKAALGCKVCGEDEPVALDLHHEIDKEATVSDAVKAGWAETRIIAEMKKCVVLCANCHRKFHAGIIKI